MPDAVTLPKYFSENGYWAGGAGKIFHNNMPDSASWDDYYPSKEKHMPDYVMPAPPEQLPVNMPQFDYLYRDFDWYPLTGDDQESLSDRLTGDFKSVNWVIQQLNRSHEKPFFLACGIYRPHVPWYVPKKYFEMYPLDSVTLPEILENDVEDLSDRAKEIVVRGGNYHNKIIASDKWREAVQGYLASITYADQMVGYLLDALETSSYADNTIVVLWSDHGWQLGEKQHWRKFALWENVARTVLMIKAPKGTPGLRAGSQAGSYTARMTSLLDIFPTLIDLCGLPEKQGLDGRSLVPLLEDPNLEWPYPAITTYDYNEFSIRTEQYRYIQYIDGSEELYDHSADPEEWNNLVQDDQYTDALAKMREYVPNNPAPFVQTSYAIMDHHIPPFGTVDAYEARLESDNFQRWMRRNRE